MLPRSCGIPQAREIFDSGGIAQAPHSRDAITHAKNAKGVQEGVRGDGPTTSRMRGTSKGAQGGRFFYVVAAPTGVRGRFGRFSMDGVCGLVE